MNEQLTLIRGWHSTPYKFEGKLTAETARQRRQNHPNGELGLWLTIVEDHWSIRRYGGNLYQVELSPDNITGVMTITELMGWAREFHTTEDYKQKRQQLVSAGLDILLVKESNDELIQGIVLNYDVIRSYEKVS